MSDLRFVFKYELHPAQGGVHEIPEGSKFLDLQMQNGIPVMWWSVPRVMESNRTWTFHVVPTGGPGYPDDLHYVGTFQLGGFVGHVMSTEPVPRAATGEPR